MRGILNGIALFADIFAFFVLGVSIVIWIIIFPLSLYRTLTGKEPHRALLIDIAIKYSIIFTMVLIAVRLIALHSGYPAGDDPIGELMALGRSTNLVSSLLELSG
ncbi:hypothetical protein JCM16138_03000 [Thermococcus atlanticus]